MKLSDYIESEIKSLERLGCRNISFKSATRCEISQNCQQETYIAVDVPLDTEVNLPKLTRELVPAVKVEINCTRKGKRKPEVSVSFVTL